ncbi:MAG: hypothetical protein U1A78_15415 [Polyangia bacterium]
MIIHAPNCRLRKRTQYNFHVREVDGNKAVRIEDEDDTDDYWLEFDDVEEKDFPLSRFIRQLKASDMLSAELMAFGVLPPLDADIAELVFAVNDVPGIMTEFSCRGHQEEEDTTGYILFYASNMKALRRFTDMLGGILRDKNGNRNPYIRITTEYCLPQSTYYDKQLQMVMRMSAPGENAPPATSAYTWLAQQIREQLARRGLVCPAGCTRQPANPNDKP